MNEDGTHVHNIKKNKFQTIHRHESKNSSWVDHKVSVFGKSMIFGRLSLECFIGRELRPGETCEHIDCDRNNNSESNLLPRFHLFQANAKKCHKFQDDGKTIGVSEVHGGKAFAATVRVYTPDACSASVPWTKYFWVSHYGSKEEAKQAAIAYRKKHTLHDGMVFI